MFKINRKLEYALIALKHMHEKHPGELTTAKEISQLYGAPFDATARSLQIMARRGLLKSEQGSHGGYLIQKDLAKVSFLEFAEMIVGSLELANCLHDNSNDCCDLKETCNIISPMVHLNDRLSEFYSQLSLRELVDDGGQKAAKFAV